MLSGIKNFFCFVAVILGLAPVNVFAVPAAPILRTLSQSDNTTFSARQWGDEWSHGWEDTDGYTIVHDNQAGHWTYADRDTEGALTSSLKIVGRDARPYGVQRKLRPAGKAREKILSLKKSGAVLRSAAGVAAASQKVVSPTGTANIPVLLINFIDRTTTYTADDFNNLLFGSGNWSMKDYYAEVSYGAFSVSGGPMGVSGWYTAANTHDYYGKDAGGSGNDSWPGDLVYDAVKAADASGFNFAPYDMDEDCYVDVVNIIHQGTGQEADGPSTDIWSHSWNLNEAYSQGASHHGEYTTSSLCAAGGHIKVNAYVIQPEILFSSQQTIGVFAHEYGHSLGLPDLYDTDYSSEGIGQWSIMASGSWNYVTDPGDRPAHFDAWSKYFLGWITPNEVSGTLTNQPVNQAESNPEIFKLRDGTSVSGEYFLIENRQNVGFDTALPGSGLLIWHIDGDKINAAQSSNSVNNYACYPGGPSCTLDHYGVKLVQADNFWEMERNINDGNAGDTYPGTSDNRAFNTDTYPVNNLYNGFQSYISVTDISNSGPVMTATLSSTIPDTTPPAAPIGLNATPGSWTNDNSFAINWTNPSDPSGISGAYYKLGSPPTSNTNGIYTANKPFNVSATAQGGQTIYVWLIDSEGNRSYINRASSTLYYDGTAPAAGTLTASSDITRISLSWTGFTDSGGSGINSYKLVFSTSGIPETCDSGTQIYLGSGTSYIHSPITGGTTYYYRVCATDNAGNISLGSTITTLAGVIPLSPDKNETITSCSYYAPPEFHWQTNQAFTTIALQFSIDNLFTSPLTIQGKTGINTLIIASKKWKKILLLPGAGGGTVYWRVAGTKANKSMVYSDPSSFIVEGAGPVSGMNIFPAIKLSLPVISWNNNCGIKFKASFSNNSNFLVKKSLSFSVSNPTRNGGVFSRGLTSKQWTAIRSVTGNVSGSTIYWYVESWDALNRYAKTGVTSFTLGP